MWWRLLVSAEHYLPKLFRKPFCKRWVHQNTQYRLLKNRRGKHAALALLLWLTLIFYFISFFSFLHISIYFRYKNNTNQYSVHKNHNKLLWYYLPAWASSSSSWSLVPWWLHHLHRLNLLLFFRPPPRPARCRRSLRGERKTVITSEDSSPMWNMIVTNTPNFFSFSIKAKHSQICEIKKAA